MKPNDCYVGTAPCGCLTVWISMDIPQKELAKRVAKYMAQGYVMTPANTEAIRSSLGACKCKKGTDK